MSNARCLLGWQTKGQMGSLGPSVVDLDVEGGTSGVGVAGLGVVWSVNSKGSRTVDAGPMRGLALRLPCLMKGAT